MKRSLLIPLMLLLISGSLQAQTLKDWMMLGKKSLERGDPYGAVLYFQKAMKIDSSKGELQFFYAEALRKSHMHRKAMYYYDKVYRKDLGREYPSELYWLAKLQQEQADYRKSRRSWLRLKRLYRHDEDNFYYKAAIQQMKSCDVARQMMQEDTTKVKLHPLPPPIQNPGAEFAGILLPDSSLIFSALWGDIGKNGEVNGPYEIRPYKATKKDSSWIDPKMLNMPGFPDSLHCGNGSISPDGKTFYCSVCQTTDTCQIWAFNYNAGTITNGHEIPEINTVAGSSTQPMMAQVGDSTILFFASNRPGGKGQFDIWLSYYTSPGNFSAPKNAGNWINTEGNEITPFYDSAEQNLYLSSDWHHGLGGYDIFRYHGTPGNWEEEKNLGYPYNSSYNDLYFYLNHKQKTGLLVSNRPVNPKNPQSACCNNIYYFKLAELEKKNALPKIATLNDLNKYLPVTLYFHNDEPNPRSQSDTTALTYFETYRHYSSLQPQYEEEYSKGLKGDAAENAMENMGDFFLNKVDQGVQNLNLFTELLEKELKKGERIELTVQGFASPLAATSYNIRLTSRRIISLYNYFYHYKDGELRPYLDGTAKQGRLSIQKVPYGEYRASNLVSDNVNDQSHSVYSIAAATERKIEITSVQRAPSDTALAEMIFSQLNIDLGKQTEGTLSAQFQYSNKGSIPVVIDSVKANCKCISVKYSQDPLAPGKNGTIDVTWDASGLTGKQFEPIKVYTNDGLKEISVTAEIDE